MSDEPKITIKEYGNALLVPTGMYDRQIAFALGGQAAVDRMAENMRKELEWRLTATDEERAERSRMEQIRQEEWRADLAAKAQSKYETDIKRGKTLLEIAPEGLLTTLVTMHQRHPHFDYDYCTTCSSESGGYDSEPEPWPCATFLTLEEGLAVSGTKS